MGAVGKADRAAELAMVRTNVEAVVDLCTLFVPGMVTRHRGAVLNTASTAAFQPLPGQAALRRLEGLRPLVRTGPRRRAARHRRHVTTLCPGPVETGFAEAAGMTDAEAASRCPSSCGSRPTDVAKAAVDGLAAGRAGRDPRHGQPRDGRGWPT